MGRLGLTSRVTKSLTSSPGGTAPAPAAGGFGSLAHDDAKSDGSAAGGGFRFGSGASDDAGVFTEHPFLLFNETVTSCASCACCIHDHDRGNRYSVYTIWVDS